MKPFQTLPRAAAWRHAGARDGFEVVFFTVSPDGVRAHGSTSAVEEGEPWHVEYDITLDLSWHTRSAWIRSRSSLGVAEIRVESDGVGHWTVNGEPQPLLDGLYDVDLESSAMTNAFPVHRMDLPLGVSADAPAVYVRAVDLRVERLEQQYTRTGDTSFDYASPAFDTYCRLDYDPSGLVVNYPGIAIRESSLLGILAEG
ncbi:putative glycolipid-binding domain-containing protein [Herbidospora cretacea]|uniref:putative glycolipid-binding domain-containing protein n=1 Tax=Herbidospora cretacea TaxID=28444 RepID=UPI000774ADCA|nr:putative glycolipid-binding domain-containing protein [Herbidospora cretacea]